MVVASDASTSEPPWKRLIRFESNDIGSRQIYFGEPILCHTDLDIGKLSPDSLPLQARLIEGNPLSPTCVVHKDKVMSVSRLLGPLTPPMVPAVFCIGFNYVSHAKEASSEIKLPKYPVIFLKPPYAIGDFGADVVIPKVAQDPQTDWEVELTVVIGRDCKNVSKEDAMDYVLGYTVGNDVSARKWQLDPELAGPLPQVCFAKGFDGFAPLGPSIVSKATLSLANLHIETRVNGQVRQQGNTKDLLFDVPTLISFLSQGTTLAAGSVIMTGTPSGVGFKMNPPQFLKPGDRVEMTIEGIGTLRHGIAHA